MILVAIEIVRGLLHQQWTEMDCRFGVCRVARADTQNAKKNLGDFPHQSVGSMLQTLPIFSSDFMKCVKEL